GECEWVDDKNLALPKPPERASLAGDRSLFPEIPVLCLWLRHGWPRLGISLDGSMTNSRLCFQQCCYAARLDRAMRSSRKSTATGGGFFFTSALTSFSWWAKTAAPRMFFARART